MKQDVSFWIFWARLQSRHGEGFPYCFIFFRIMYVRSSRFSHLHELGCGYIVRDSCAYCIIDSVCRFCDCFLSFYFFGISFLKWVSPVRIKEKVQT